MSTVRLSVSASGPAAGYPGHHASNPNLLPQLMEAAMEKAVPIDASVQ